MEIQSNIPSIQGLENFIGYTIETFVSAKNQNRTVELTDLSGNIAIMKYSPDTGFYISIGSQDIPLTGDEIQIHFTENDFTIHDVSVSGSKVFGPYNRVQVGVTYTPIEDLTLKYQRDAWEASEEEAKSRTEYFFDPYGVDGPSSYIHPRSR